jgi:hypothetical protein
MKGPERYIATRNQWVKRSDPEIASATITVRGVTHTLLDNHIRVSLKQNGTVLFYHSYQYLEDGGRARGRWYKNGLPVAELPSLENPVFTFRMTGYEIDNNPLDTATAVVRIVFTPKGVRKALKAAATAPTGAPIS